MANETRTVCDRCGSDVRGKGHVVRLDGGPDRDMCDPCFGLLRSWVGRDNATAQGDRRAPAGMRGPGWREVCPHHVPCGGPCPTPHYTRA